MMQRPKAKIDAYSVESATTRAIDWRESVVKSAIGVLTDHEKDHRLKLCLCVTCYYVNNSRIGGSAITNRPCGVCEQDMTFCNTCTDVVCSECGKQHELCVRCGADLKLRPRRKYSPAGKGANDGNT